MIDSKQLQGFQYLIHRISRPMTQALIAASLIAFPLESFAHQSLPIFSGSTGWESSKDGINWIPAYGSYPNPITAPVVINPDSNPERASLMWHWDEAGAPDGTSGSITALFRYKFTLDLGPNDYGAPFGLVIASDDWMTVKINSHLLGTYFLPNSQDQNDQPLPMLVYFDGENILNSKNFGKDVDGNQIRYWGDGSGENIIEIEAHDGGEQAMDHGYEWVFVDAYHITAMEGVVSFDTPLPEPSSVLLVIVGLAAFRATHYRPRSKAFTNRPFLCPEHQPSYSVLGRRRDESHLHDISWHIG